VWNVISEVQTRKHQATQQTVGAV